MKKEVLTSVISGMRILHRRTQGSFVLSATPRPSGTSRAKIYSVCIYSITNFSKIKCFEKFVDKYLYSGEFVTIITESQGKVKNECKNRNE